MTAFLPDASPIDVAVIGGGPAGLMAAERLQAHGLQVHLFDAMPSVGRKFLLAGKGGLNLTHAEGFDDFVGRYAERSPELRPMLQTFGADALRQWAADLGITTFVGSSQRVFPTDMKAAPLLRAWLQRLRHPAAPGLPVQFHMRHRWLGWHDGSDPSSPLRFHTPQGERAVQARATVLALGGASWARLGSDGAWQPWLQQAGVDLLPLVPANCGFDVAGSPVHGRDEGWTPLLAERWAGQPFKSVRLRCTGVDGEVFDRQGEFVLTATGIEGSLVYAASRLLRGRIEAEGRAELQIDLLPHRTAEWVLEQVRHPRGSRSLSSHLKSRLGIDGLKLAMLSELLDKTAMNDPQRLASAIKALPITLRRCRPIDEAISSAGGVCFEALDDQLMVRQHPGLFVAGEMLDWEAPTGGYLLTATVASGVRAGEGAARWLEAQAGR